MQLFSPVSLGSIDLANRIVMAPLTRMRASEHGVPSDLIAEHYTQRASAGLIITEGTYTSPGSKSYPGQPGIITPEQIEGWRRVTDSVHAAGGKIVMQLMHGGRVTHAAINGGLPILAPSAIAIVGEVHTPEGKLPYDVPTAIATEDMPAIVEELATAARNAIEAGFDGVEVHSANGYLLHEFLSPSSNVREDGYGGTPEKRARLGIEVVTAVAAAVGADRVGLRISPDRNIQDVLDTDAAATRTTYETFVRGISTLGLAYISVLHPAIDSPLLQDLRTIFGGPFIANNGTDTMTTREEAIALLEQDHADAVVVGRPILANPDLVRRWREERELNEVNYATVYAVGATGYTDYPALKD